MSYLLDTNVCIEFLRGRKPGIAARLTVLKRADVLLCAIVKAELYFGARRSAEPIQSLALVRQFAANFESLPFDDGAAEIYGRLRADLAREGNLIGPNDLLIASIALARRAVLVTHNTAEFSRVPDLSIEDWEVG